jgi:hypothetical protein
VFRTTWDYFDRFSEFCTWIDHAAALTRLYNPPTMVRWNMDKHYLVDFARMGIPVVASHILTNAAGRAGRERLGGGGDQALCI